VILKYVVTVEAPAEMKPLFQTLVKDVTEATLRELARRMNGSGCPTRVKEVYPNGR
jgi:hypothetical protein